MRIKLQRSYKKPSNVAGQPAQTVFVYLVTGTEEEIERYKKVQGDNFRETEDREPLFFTTRCAGAVGELVITQKDRVVVDMSRFDQAASLASQYGGNLGVELAKIAASQLMGTAASQAPVRTPVPAGETPAGGGKPLGEE